MPPKAASKKPSTASKTPAATKTYATKITSSGTAKKGPVITSQKKKRKTRKETWATYIYKGITSSSLISFLLFFVALDLARPSQVLRWRTTWNFGWTSAVTTGLEQGPSKLALIPKNSLTLSSPLSPLLLFDSPALQSTR